MSILDSVAGTVGKAFAKVFYDAVLTRETPGSISAPYSSYNPGPSGTQTFRCKAMAIDYGAYSRGQALVSASDMKVMIIGSSLATVPQALDAIVIAKQGFSGTIVADGTVGAPNVQIDPAKAMWQVRCTK